MHLVLGKERSRWGMSVSHELNCGAAGLTVQAVRANSLFKLENRNPTRLVQKPKWTRLRGKSENVYSGTRTLCLIDREKIRKSGVPEYTFSLLPLSLVHFGFCTNLVGFRLFSLNKLVERTVRARGCHKQLWLYGGEKKGGEKGA